MFHRSAGAFALACLVGASLAPAGQAAPIVIFNTGQVGMAGGSDPNYSLSGPAGGPQATITTARPQPPWVVAPANSQWVAPGGGRDRQLPEQ